MNGKKLVLLSALDATALKHRADAVASALEANPDALPDVAYTLAVGRKRFPQRAAVVIPDGRAAGEIVRGMDRENTERTQNGASTKPRVAFMFPGQGAQFVGMAQGLFEAHDGFRDTFRSCDRFLTPRLGLSLEQLLFRSVDAERDAEVLKQTNIAQPALFVVEYCLAKTLLEYGVVPDALIGHSIGEFAAACLAGVFELEAALELVAERGRLMQSQPPGAMMAVRSAPELLEPLLSSDVTLAAHNAPELCVVSGAFDAMERFAVAARGAGLELRELHTSHAFHSPMMEPILGPFREAVERARPRAPEIPIISTLTGQPLTADEATSSDYWARQLRHAVRFADAVKLLFDSPDRVLIEVGPGTALTTSAAKQTGPARPRAMLETLGGPKDPRPAWDATLRCLGRLWIHGAALNWEVLYDGPARKLLRLPTYAFSRQLHWVEPPTSTEGGASREIRIVGASAGASVALDQKGVPQRLYALLTSRLGRSLEGDDLERSFVELGFDSLALSQLRVRLQEQFALDIPVRLLFEGQDTPRLLAEFIEQKTQAAGAADGAVSPPAGSEIAEPALPAPPSRPAPASSRSPASRPAEGPRHGATTEPQRELWVACAAGGPEVTLCYNECRRIELRGELDVSLLEKAIEEIVRRHEALRMVFNADGSEFIVQPFGGHALRTTDLRAVETAERMQRLVAYETDEVRTPFDLERGPLFRVHLVRLEEHRSVLLLCGHHIVTDGSSVFLLLRELAELYSAFKEQRPADLPTPDSYISYAERETVRAESGAGRADEEFWLRHLAGHSEDLDLPTDRPRPALRSFPAARQDFYLDAAATDALRQIGVSAKTTLQTVLMAMVQVLLQRVTRQTDIVLGMPASGQAAVGARALVGHCVNVLPIRQSLDPTKDFGDYLGDVRRTLLDCLEHQQTTFSSYLEKLGRPRDPSRIPLVPFGFGMGRTPKRLPLSGLEVDVSTVHRVYETFEIYLFATEDGEGINLAWSYNTDLFDAETIQLWQRCLEATLGSLIERRGRGRLDTLEVLSEQDRQVLLRHALGPQTAPEDYVAPHERILQRGASFPERTAVIATDATLTYAELNRRANQLGQWLVRQGLEPGSLVAVCLERTSQLIWSLLGVWRAGLAYVPLDPKYPKARVQMILEDSQAPVVLTSRELAEEVIGHEHAGPVRIVLIEDILAELEREPDLVPEVARDPEHRAYVIFTSGSTGRPKGVQISQRAFENFLVSMAKVPGFSAEERILALTTISFDIAGLELFLSLTQGASLVLVSADQAMDPHVLAGLAEQHGVTALQATPATWQMLLDGGWQGDPRLKVLCGGEAFPQKLAERLLACCGEVWNVYGPTETTVWSSVKRVERATDLSIGRPIDNTTMYILDDNLGLAPLGSGGELWIGGRGVAAGYLGRPDLTAERFKPSPFVAGDVIYRTGDLGRVRRDGEFECLGRVDFQVKIRGFRIELGEIETAMLNQPGVLSAVVVAREDEPGNKVLVAYAVPKPGERLDVADLRQRIAGLLPAYMVPSAFVALEQLPMTPNNKVDRKALPRPASAGDVAYEAPDLPREKSAKEMLWRRSWVEAQLSADLLPPSSFLLLGDDDELARTVTALLRKGGHTVTVVHARDRYHEAAEDVFSVNPEVGREHFEQLLRRLDELGRTPDRVLHLWLAATETRVRGGSSPLHHHRERGLFALVHLSALFANLFPERALTFHVATTTLHHARVAKDDRAKAAALGLAALVPSEFPRQKLSFFELSPDASRATKKAASEIATEVLRGPTEPLVSSQGGKRRQGTWARAEAKNQQAKVPAAAAIVFGLSTLGLAVARRLAAREGVRVAYLVPSEMGGNPALEAELSELEQAGSVTVRRGLQLASHVGLRQGLTEVTSELGAIRTVVLAPPPGAPLLLEMATEGDLEAGLAPLVQGLWALDQLPKKQLGLLVVLSSLDAALGSAGTLPDAATSHLLELEQYRDGCRVVVAHVNPGAATDGSDSARAHVAKDRAYFNDNWLDAREQNDVVDLLLGLDTGTYLVSPFELGAYRARLERLAARDAAERSGKRFVEPKNETERRLANLWAQALRLDRVSTEDSFFDLGGHSLLAVRLFAAINKEFGVALPLAALFAAPTVSALAQQLGDGASAAEASANGEASLLIKLNRGFNGHAPLFVVHGAFGNVLNLRHLARLADPGRDFYGIQAQGLDGSAPPHQTLVEAATKYVEELREVQPHGPYHLGGFCVGGVVALEMARLLKESGEEVEPLVLLDSHLPEQRGTLSMRDRLQIQLERLRSEQFGYVQAWARGKYNYESRRLKKGLGLLPDESDPTQYRSQLVRDAIDHGMRTYEPRYYDGDVVLFRPPLAPHHHLTGDRKVNVRRFFLLEDNGWRRVVRNLRVVELASPPGDHDGFVLEPHVRDLARRLKPLLNGRD